jgi:hypothetical protein
MPDRNIPNPGRGRLIADACKGARIPRERSPNCQIPRYLLGAGLGSSDLATPFPPIG